MVELTIDNQKIEVDEGLTVLEAAREASIEIPTLCHHPALTPYGSCRLCSVEIKSGNISKIAVSCTYPVEEGIEVKTNSELIIKGRRMVVEYFLARCPEVKEIQDLAKKMGVIKPRFSLEESDCILCGLCARACSEIVGVGAISITHRGYKRELKTPFDVPSSVCISCGTCITLCPTGAIKLEKIDNTTMIHDWTSGYKKRRCRVCGDYHLSTEFPLDYKKWFSEE